MERSLLRPPGSAWVVGSRVGDAGVPRYGRGRATGCLLHHYVRRWIPPCIDGGPMGPGCRAE
ncbi:MAG: hypothetical protein AVDCRST_MAG19-1244 [uncultured Thermomicrobiales bacterium]|uniref:Uncharacterized protein n=1 Tax=uncultured Thermomicrobiales bacterium TaxID=1645740 RepID=A0A6J4UNS6_9BACT|nr:MAG: hypothetical protein AVDCRST_MAG19-1244 [uncultured Thermomicrobiales bacterium]